MAEATSSETVEQKGDVQDASAVEVCDAELPGVAESASRGGDGQIDILLDTPMEISACLGTSQLPIRELLQTGPGSVLTLDRTVGEPVDLHLRGIRFATGQLVVVGDQLGVRIEEILSNEAASDEADTRDA